jgi:CO/xanthine dehydrogenase FAD-binding subunit/aerobic-type carbon monoxide dehydrogenase small subunit (CoxS/CutS family)
MRPAYPKEFKYIKARGVEDALEAVKAGAKPLAGGQSLSTLLKLRLIEVETLVDIFELDELRYVERRGDSLVLGALLIHNDVAMLREVVSWAPALSKAAWMIADLQVRNRGTLGGSLAHADPAANYIPPLLALDATVRVRSSRGVRAVKMTELVLGPYQTALEPDEIIVEVEVPRWDIQGTYVLKVGGASYPSLILSLAARLEDGIVKESRLAVGGYYTRPFVVEGAFDGEKLSEDAAAKAVGLFPDGEPYDDPHLAFEKKRQILPTVLTRLIREASAGQWRLPIKEEITRWRGRNQETVVVNGRALQLEGEPRLLLVDFLRRQGYTEVKRGCDEGRCGACTVLLDGKAVKSCTVFAPQAAGHEIRTAKGIMGAGLHPVQRAFLEEYASQCGFCTHGFVTTVTRLPQLRGPLGKRRNSQAVCQKHL